MELTGLMVDLDRLLDQAVILFHCILFQNDIEDYSGFIWTHGGFRY